MTKAKVQEIYGLLETNQEAIEQDGLVEIKDGAVARLIIETNPENALEMKTIRQARPNWIMLLLETYYLNTLIQP